MRQAVDLRYYRVANMDVQERNFFETSFCADSPREGAVSLPRIDSIEIEAV
jgi:hypothetical protein